MGLDFFEAAAASAIPRGMDIGSKELQIFTDLVVLEGAKIQGDRDGVDGFERADGTEVEKEGPLTESLIWQNNQSSLAVLTTLLGNQSPSINAGVLANIGEYVQCPTQSLARRRETLGLSTPETISEVMPDDARQEAIRGALEYFGVVEPPEGSQKPEIGDNSWVIRALRRVGFLKGKPSRSFTEKQSDEPQLPLTADQLKAVLHAIDSNTEIRRKELVWSNREAMRLAILNLLIMAGLATAVSERTIHMYEEGKRLDESRAAMVRPDTTEPADALNPEN